MPMAREPDGAGSQVPDGAHVGSAPYAGLPHVTTDPSSLRAATAWRVVLTLRTPDDSAPAGAGTHVALGVHA